MSESLAWEKWSTFSHNRYVEEAEKFSRPGSVAQKKAFFEAHYKKVAAQRAAAALLEQEKSSSSSNSVVETTIKQNVDDVGCSASPQTSNGVQQQKQEVEVANGQDFVANDNGSGNVSGLMEGKIGSREAERAHSGTAHQEFDEIPHKVELEIKVEGVDLNDGLTENEFNRTPQMEKSLPKVMLTVSH